MLDGTASYDIRVGHALDVMRGMPDASVHCCVTSPPYFGLRDYGTPPQVWGGDPACAHEWNGTAFCECGAWRGSLGLEPTAEMYVEHIVEIFREVRRVLRPDGTLWLVIGDSYARDAAKGQHKPGDPGKHAYIYDRGAGRASSIDLRSEVRGSGDGLVGRGDRAAVPNGGPGLKSKDLVGIPWMVAFALRADGWWLRSDNIWAKPNPIPESVGDRTTRAHEYVFTFSRSGRPTCWRHRNLGWTYSRPAPDYVWRSRATGEESRDPVGDPGWFRYNMWRAFDYYYEKDAIAEESVTGDSRRPYVSRGAREMDSRAAEQWRGGTARHPPNVRRGEFDGKTNALPGREAFRAFTATRNKRSVWTVPLAPRPEAHFATFPPRLIEPCILAGCPPGGVVLDPFAGSGTVGEVARRLGRRSLLLELSTEYARMIEERLA